MSNLLLWIQKEISGSLRNPTNYQNTANSKGDTVRLEWVRGYGKTRPNQHDCRMIPIQWLYGTEYLVQYHGQLQTLFLTNITGEYYWKKGTALKCGREVIVTQEENLYLRPRDAFAPFPQKKKEILKKQALERLPHDNTTSTTLNHTSES